MMDSNKRIVVNTLAQHIRTVISLCLSLYSTRLILQALGETDFGIYSLVAGVVFMLSFLTNAMVITTQRHLSFSYGRKDKQHIRTVFTNSLLLHWIFGIILVGVLLLLESIVFNNLRIDSDRLHAGIAVYRIMALAIFVMFITAPYRAILIARENIVYISIIDVLDGVFKLILAIWLLHISYDRLITYSWMYLGVIIFNFFAFAIWSVQKYEESVFIPRAKMIDKKCIKEITGFAGWTIYSLGCVIGRNQGVGVVFNRFFGTAINAAYGIALQISYAVQNVAQAISNAMSPQIIKAEGDNERKKMLQLTESLCKYSFLMLSMLTIPLSFEMDTILQVWLGKVSDHTALLCQFVLLCATLDQLTLGLNVANQATGNIRNYSVTINSIKLLTLPFMVLILYFRGSVLEAMWCYAFFELVCAVIRLPFMKRLVNLSIYQYFKRVIFPVIIPTLTLIVCSILVTTYCHFQYRFLFTVFLSIVITLPTIWFFALGSSERTAAIRMIKRNK